MSKKVKTKLLESYLECPTKYFLYASVITPTGNCYAEWLDNKKETYRSEGLQRLRANYKKKDIYTGILRKSDSWKLAYSIITDFQNLEASIDAIEKTEDMVEILPIRFSCTNKVTKNDKLVLAFAALILSKTLGYSVNKGKVIYGDNYTNRKIDVSAQVHEVKKIIPKINALISSSEPPPLILNRHCSECEFQERCKKIALERDDLSLIAKLPVKQREKLYSKGIFTVTQFSYTFRPRRRSKRNADKPERYHYSLKALAIREQKIHIVGNPVLKIDGTPVFLDVECLPDKDFYYLIGVRIKTAKGYTQHSLWADDKKQEPKIWFDFLNILSKVESPILIHYGRFESTFIKKMHEKYGEKYQDSAEIEKITNSFNILSVIYAKIYFPTYSNSLKDIAAYLDYQWHNPKSSGLHSIVWRSEWENSHDSNLKQQLIRYNEDDCKALSLVFETISTITETDLSINQPKSTELGVVHTDFLKKNSGAKLGNFKSSISGMEAINNAARWDYQRERIYVRTGVKSRTPKKRKLCKAEYEIEKTVIWKVSQRCPMCNKQYPKKGKVLSRTMHDLLFRKSSLKRKFIKYVFQIYHCRNCGHKYGLDPRFGHASRKYSWNVLSYFIFNIISLRLSQNTVLYTLNKLLDFDLGRGNLNNMKTLAGNYYLETRNNILNRIIKSDLIHADETRANIRGQTAYVWVLTNMQEVVYILTESREGAFIQDLLANFKGVLVSDFYAVYDSIDCPQQKCLIHIMRDLNDDLLKYAFDEELKTIATEFTTLLQTIIATIDSRGLKKHFLRKHKKDVDKFYKKLDRLDTESKEALKYKKRFEKNRNKLFTFLNYDGIPWNNNNAEHAIKSFAMLRNIISGPSTKKGTEEYLTLLSICKTCEYQGLDFLDFLRSGKTDVSVYANSTKKNQLTF